MKCLIIAAGRGSRLQTVCDSKPLLKLNGIPLIEHVILSAMESGINEFCIVTGFRGDEIKRRLTDFSVNRPVSFEFVYNPQWEKGNGISVYSGSNIINDQFVLLMSDHIFDPDILTELINEGIGDKEIKLAVDKKIVDNTLIDLEDVTKVYEEDGKIVNIGKSLPHYNCFDTGIFLCSPDLFGSLKKSISDGDESLSGGIHRIALEKKALIFDIKDKFWLDIDDENAFHKAKMLNLNNF